jgi:two-component system LytT family response regulator
MPSSDIRRRQIEMSCQKSRLAVTLSRFFHSSIHQQQNRTLLWYCGGAALWLLVALVSGVQGQLFATYHGRSQEWWPTFGYTVAVFSVWALLTPVVLKAAEKVSASGISRLNAAALYLMGFPITTGLHLLIFVLLFWPVYGSAAPTPWAMAKPVLLANLDKAAFAYLALLAMARALGRLRERTKIEAQPAGSSTTDDGLWIRVTGGSRRVQFEEIDWIAAAGDYAEVHSGGRSVLADVSLTALATQLPGSDFARIHRSAIVRLDRVREVRRLGRGDASVHLHTGQTLRMSRRYRDNLTARLPLTTRSAN